jgi:hypothetical protein
VLIGLGACDADCRKHEDRREPDHNSLAEWIFRLVSGLCQIPREEFPTLAASDDYVLII